MIRALMASVALLALVSGLSWHLGNKLHDETVKAKALTKDLAICEEGRQQAIETTQAWSDKYNMDMAAKDEANAKQIEDLRAKTKATCSAQFNAGYNYGLRIGHDKPDRVRSEDGDFAEYWASQAGKP